MTAVPSEVWGFCSDCQRWFYCAGWSDETAPAPTCPVCSGDPVAIEHGPHG